MAKVVQHLDVNGVQKPFGYPNFYKYAGIGPSHSTWDAKHAPPAPHFKSSNSVAAALVRVQVSQACMVIVTSLILRVLVIPLLAQILDRLIIADNVIAKRCLILDYSNPT